MSHKVYEQYSEIILNPDVSAGNACPEDCGGNLTKLPPGMIVKVSGQGFAKVTKYTVEKLRCNLCGLQINAPMPDDVSDNKYDAGLKPNFVCSNIIWACHFTGLNITSVHLVYHYLMRHSGL